MKAIITTLTVIFCFASLHLSAQDTRLFYQTGGFDYTSNFTVVEKDGNPFFITVKEKDGDFIKMAYGSLDESTLSPISYTYITLPIEINQYREISGVNLVGDRLDIVFQCVNATFTRFVFMEIDLATNSVLNTYSTSDIFAIRFSRARSINQKLVLYGLIQSTGKIVRMEKGLTGSVVTDTIQGNYTFYNNQAKISELESIDNIEYLAVITGSQEVTLVKRESDGQYLISSQSLNVGSTSKLWDFIPFQNGLLFLNGNNIFRMNNNFVIQEHILGNYYSITSGRVEAIFKNNKLFVYKPQGEILVLDEMFNPINSIETKRNIMPLDVIVRGNDFWLLGCARDGEYFFETPNGITTSLVIIRNNNSLDFDEHFRWLNWNNMEMRIGNYNGLFSMGNEGTAGLRYMMNDTLRSGPIFASYDMLLGKNESDELVGTWQKYSEQSSRLPGPLFTSVADSNLQRDKYNRSYYVTAQMISDHVAHVVTYGNPNYGMPNGIRYWPANGNTANGEAAKIADFIDVNGNGVYEPHLGEFPKIYGDECLLTVYHQPDTDTLGNNLEVHRYLFTYDCDTNEVLNNTLFCNVRYINRGADMHDVFLGSFIDFDIGYSADDYVGTNVQLGMIYGYNGDVFDETNGSQIGFKDSIPAMGQLILKGAKQENDGIDNAVGVGNGESINGVGFGDGMIDNEFYTLESSYFMSNSGTFPYTDGVNPVQFYYNLQGLASDGTASPFGRYHFIGSSDPDFYSTGGVPHTNDWSEISVGNPSGDRRMLSGSGPGVLLAGDTLNYLSAYILSFGAQNDPQGPSVGQLFTDAAKIKSYFANNDLGCGKTFDLSDESLNVKQVEKLDFSVYPNPFKDELFIRHEFQGNVSLTIRNLNGQEVYQQGDIKNQQYVSVELTSGIYFVELTSAKGSVVKKLVRK